MSIDAGNDASGSGTSVRNIDSGVVGLMVGDAERFMMLSTIDTGPNVTFVFLSFDGDGVSVCGFGSKQRNMLGTNPPTVVMRAAVTTAQAITFLLLPA